MVMALANGGGSGSAVVWVPLLVAILGGMVAVLTVILTGQANRKLEREKFEADQKLERQKFESSLILRAVATDNQDTALKNLQFLVRAKFLPDSEGQIKALADEPGDTPVLPGRSGGEEWWSAPIRPGKFRWGVRTGSDADAAHVKETPVKTTVEKLVKEPRPPEMLELTKAYPAYQNRRAEGVERTIYELEADIIGFKLEASGNYHLTLKGDTGQTMIATCPDPDPQFVDPSSRWRKEIAAVRKQVAERLQPGRSMERLRKKERVSISGVGFFNQVRGQSGIAPNGIELAPVLSIVWLSQAP